MKKLITLTFVITALLLGAIAISAQPYRKGKYKKAKSTQNTRNSDVGHHNNGHRNYRGVYTYHKTKFVWKRGHEYKNTYKIKVFRNGRKKVKLLSSVPVHRRHIVNVYKEVQVIRQGRKKYRVTYKVTEFSNGRIKKQVIKKVRIYNNRNW